MKKINKPKWIVGGILLALVVAFGTVFGVSLLAPEKALDLSAFPAEPAAEPPVSTGPLTLSGEGYQPVAENSRFTLELDPAEVSLRVTDKVTGTVWYSGYPVEEYEGEVIPRNRRIMRALCTMSYTDFDADAGAINSSADEVEVAYGGLENGLEVHFTFPEQAIGVTVQFILDESGFRARVPADQLKEEGDYGIVQVDLLPSFGSLMAGKDGYILYPDGCGALYDCKEKTGYEDIYTADVYGSHILDLDTTLEQATVGYKTITIPYYGSAAQQRAFIAYIEEGAANASLSFSPASTFFNLNRVYPSIVYRRMMLRTTPDNKEMYVTEKAAAQEDLCVKYLLLTGDDADYAGMATALRGHMQAIGRLPQQGVASDTMPLALEILAGTRESNLYGSSGLAMTTYKQAQGILDELSQAGVSSLRTILLGWQKEGYGVTPASAKTAGYLGSAGDLKTLLAAYGRDANRIYLQADYVFASGGSFSQRNDVVNSFLNMPVTNAEADTFLLNPYKQLVRFRDKDLAAYQRLAPSGLAFDSLSALLPSDSGKNRRLTAAEAARLYGAMPALAKEQGLSAAVQGGSDYTLRQADYIYNLSDDDSNLFLFTRSIPFSQILLHGVIPYSCAMPGNMSSDFTQQKLKWVEYGSMPYFLVSQRPSNDLRDTKIDDVFSSRFTDWKGTIVATWQEMNERLAPLAGVTIVSHRDVTADVVEVGYATGHTVLVNYGGQAAVVDGVTVPARDYVVTTP